MLTLPQESPKRASARVCAHEWVSVSTTRATIENDEVHPKHTCLRFADHPGRCRCRCHATVLVTSQRSAS